jgi:hypothetical protein
MLQTKWHSVNFQNKILGARPLDPIKVITPDIKKEIFVDTKMENSDSRSLSDDDLKANVYL